MPPAREATRAYFSADPHSKNPNHGLSAQYNACTFAQKALIGVCSKQIRTLPRGFCRQKDNRLSQFKREHTWARGRGGRGRPKSVPPWAKKMFTTVPKKTRKKRGFLDKIRKISPPKAADFFKFLFSPLEAKPLEPPENKKKFKKPLPPSSPPSSLWPTTYDKESINSLTKHTTGQREAFSTKALTSLTNGVAS